MVTGKSQTSTSVWDFPRNDLILDYQVVIIDGYDAINHVGITKILAVKSSFRLSLDKHWDNGYPQTSR